MALGIGKRWSAVEFGRGDNKLWVGMVCHEKHEIKQNQKKRNKWPGWVQGTENLHISITALGLVTLGTEPRGPRPQSLDGRDEVCRALGEDVAAGDGDR